MTTTTCPRCNERTIEKTSQKTGKTFKVNPDGSYHSIPVTQPDGTTKWYCSKSKEHEVWIKDHNGPSGFVQPTQEQHREDVVRASENKSKPNELTFVPHSAFKTEEILNFQPAVLAVENSIAEAEKMVERHYPFLQKDTNIYGQIRSKFTDQILSAYNSQQLQSAVLQLDSNV